jgi:hypothetical protein
MLFDETDVPRSIKKMVGGRLEESWFRRLETSAGRYRIGEAWNACQIHGRLSLHGSDWVSGGVISAGGVLIAGGVIIAVGVIIAGGVIGAGAVIRGISERCCRISLLVLVFSVRFAAGCEPSD